MSVSASGEEQEATELLDETQRLRQKRDLLTKENEQLKTYLRLRQMESTATCEQLKSEIEQQIEQFEALGDQSFNDSQTSHLETLKSFRSEIEAIQCWNAKIRNKYFSRHAMQDGPAARANQLTDDVIEQMVATSSSAASDKQVDNDDNQCANESNVATDDSKSEVISSDEPKPKNKTSKRNATRSAAKVSCDVTVEEVDNKEVNTIKTRLRSQDKQIIDTDVKRKKLSHKEDKNSQKTSKRRRN